MYGLTNEEKLEFIIKKSEELGVKGYEFGKNTTITTSTADNILNRESKNPRTKNLNIMLEYLEKKVLGSKLDNKERDSPLLKEPHSNYIPKKTQDKVVPYYDIVIANQSMASFEDVREHIEYYIDFKPLNDCTAYLPYFGNAMQPMFCSGNTLAVKQITNLEILLWGEPHFIITNNAANNYKTVRCLHQHNDPEKVILRAVNPHYSGDVVIEKKNILSLYIVRGKIELNE